MDFVSLSAPFTRTAPLISAQRTHTLFHLFFRLAGRPRERATKYKKNTKQITFRPRRGAAAANEKKIYTTSNSLTAVLLHFRNYY
jgi:hypothetical protein